MRYSPSSGREIPWWRGRLQLGEALDTQNVRAAYSNGALTLTIPVTAAAQPRRIEVQHGQGQQQIDLTGQLPVADAAGSSIQGAQQ